MFGLCHGSIIMVRMIEETNTQTYKQPMVSVIVPFYNSAHTIVGCLSSLSAQHFKDFEVIAIDDGSTDDGLALAQDYAKNDRRFRIYSTGNGGVSQTRNRGIAHAKGRFIAFVDADDLVNTFFLQHLLTAQSINGAPLVKTGYKERETNDIVLPHTCGKETGRKAFVQLLTGRDKTDPPVWNTLIERDFLETHSLRFDERLKMAEDVVFLAQVYAHADFIERTAAHDYCYSPTPRAKRAQRLGVCQVQYVKQALAGDKVAPLTRHQEDAVTDYLLRLCLAQLAAATPRTMPARQRHAHLKELRQKGVYATVLTDGLSAPTLPLWARFAGQCFISGRIRLLDLLLNAFR